MYRCPNVTTLSCLRFLEQIPPAQCFHSRSVQAGKIALDDLEKLVFPDFVVFMPQDVAKRPDLLPRLIRHQVQGHVPKLCSRFADPFQAALHGILDFAVFLEGG